jgi:PTS system nitrogen regulatory IIA component
MLGVSEKMLFRWARQGVIPAFEKEGGLRFGKKAVAVWAKSRGMTLKKQRPSGSRDDLFEPNVGLLQAMRRGGFFFDIAGSDIPSVFRTIIEKVDLPEGVDGKELFRRLLDRERLASTGIGNGIAIPHPRHPFQSAPEGGMICTCFLKEGIDFSAVDNQEVSVLFVMLSPNTKLHLHLLSRLSFCLHESVLISELDGSRDEKSLLESIEAIEERFLATRSRGGL